MGGVGCNGWRFWSPKGALKAANDWLSPRGFGRGRWPSGSGSPSSSRARPRACLSPVQETIRDSQKAAIRQPRRRRNPFRVVYNPVNVKNLAKFPADSEVSPESLRASGIVRSLRQPIKVLGDGELTVVLTVRTHRVSASARAKIEHANGASIR